MLYRLVLSLSKVKWFTVLSLFVIAALLLSVVAAGKGTGESTSARAPRSALRCTRICH